MNSGALVMYVVAGVLAIVAVTLFLRLRGPRSERARYGHLIAGTMAAAASIMLFAYATALTMWSSAL